MQKFVFLALVGAVASLRPGEYAEHSRVLHSTFEALSYNAKDTTAPVVQGVAECGAAYATFMASKTGECSALFSTFDETTEAASQAGVAANCPTCGDRVKNEIQNVWNECEGIGVWNTTQRAAVRFFVLVAKLACAQHTDGQYCLPKVKALNNLDNSTVVDQTTLDNVCHPCNAVWLKLYAAVSTDPDTVLHIAQIGLICTKYAGDFCLLKFQAANSLPPNTFDAQVIDSGSLSTVCEPCVRVFLRRTVWLQERMGTVDPQAGQFLKNLHLLCSKRANGDFCLPTIQSSGASNFDNIGAQCGADIANGTCSQGCKTAVQTAKTDMGCCMGTLMRMVSVNSSGTFDEAAIRGAFATACNLTLPVSCNAAPVIVKLVLLNVVAQWVNNNIADLRERARKDVSYLLGVDLDEVAVDTNARRAGEPEISLSIDSDLLSTADQTALSNFWDSLVSDGAPLLELDQIPDEAKIDALSSVTDTVSPGPGPGPGPGTQPPMGAAASPRATGLLLLLTALVVAVLS